MPSIFSGLQVRDVLLFPAQVTRKKDATPIFAEIGEQVEFTQGPYQEIKSYGIWNAMDV